MNKYKLVFLIVIAALGVQVNAQTQQISIHLNGDQVAQTFDGIGSVFSYEKLFYDYPEQQRNEILDYLFKPKYGAALQILKVEIGYDGNNTTTSWPSHQRELNEKPNFNRGFVWWLMKEAKKRNPEIKIAALHWGYPAYANTDELKADFIYKFVEGAKKEHHITIDYIGGNQNETRLNIPVTIILRNKLDENGFKNVKIVAADEGSRVENYMSLKYIKLKPEYAKAVDIIGMHYKKRPVSSFDTADYNLGKTFWSSEDRTGPYDAFQSGYDWIDQMFKLFVELKFSAATTWLATSSSYDNMPHSKTGMIKSKEPWSGHYEIGANLWAFAHVTQFTSSGWKILNTKSNSLFKVGDIEIGKYIGFKDSQSNNFTLLMNTAQNDFPKEGLDIQIDIESLKSEPLNVWRSCFINEKEWFIKQPQISLKDGKYFIHLDKNCVYTISTLDGGKGDAVSPPAKNLKLPYSQNFENEGLIKMPPYFVDANGAFEISNGTHGNTGKVLRQVINTTPELWHHRPLSQPITEMGDIAWKDYSIEADFLMEEPGEFWMSGRFDGDTAVSIDYNLEGYWFKIDEKGDWELIKKMPKQRNSSAEDLGKFITLKAGKLEGFTINKWMNVKLSLKGTKIILELNHRQVAEVLDDTYKNGNIAFGAIRKPSHNFFEKSPEYLNVQIDNLKILPL